MIGLGEILLGLAIVVVVLGGVLFYALAQQRASLDESRKPSLPPTREPAASSPSKTNHVVVELHRGQPLAEQLRVHANTAEARGLRPILEVGATWCPPSKMFGNALTDPRIHAALAGVYLIRVDSDEFDGDSKLSELRVMSVPVFYELDADGQATGHSITGAAWGADTIENMAAALTRFCG